MKALFVCALLVLVGLTLAARPRPTSGVATPAVTQELIDEINNMGTTWTADWNVKSTVHGMTVDEARTLCGVLPGGPKLPAKKAMAEVDVAALPTQFFSYDNWCTSMSTIRDQSACGSCWAFAAVEAMSDRACIKLNKNISLSSANMAFCCSSCGDGCNGGYPAAAWEYFKSTGVAEEGCYPYPFPSCDHHIPNSPNPCPTNEYPTPPCAGKCTNTSWNGPAFKADKHFGASAYSVSGVNEIMTEIFKNGPVEAAFDVYTDFLTYKTGVYQHKSGSFVGGHAVKIVGWGVLNGTPYWRVANSWNVHWGDGGFFNILRGKDECGIEDGIVAGLVKS